MAQHYLAQFFEFRHLPPELAAVSQPFALMVQKILTNCPDNPERTTCLRKLLEAKDCAVQSMIFKVEP